MAHAIGKLRPEPISLWHQMERVLGVPIQWIYLQVQYIFTKNTMDTLFDDLTNVSQVHRTTNRIFFIPWKPRLGIPFMSDEWSKIWACFKNIPFVFLVPLTGLSYHCLIVCSIDNIMKGSTKLADS